MELIFITSDWKIVKVKQELISRSITIQTMIDVLGLKDNEEELTIPIKIGESLATENVFLKVIEWIKFYEDISPDDEKLYKKLNFFDDYYFIKYQFILVDIIMTANYFEVESLLFKSSLYLSRLIIGKSLQEIIETFKLLPDLSSQEINELEKELLWCDNPFLNFNSLSEYPFYTGESIHWELINLPDIIWERVFSHMSRNELDKCSFIYRKWRNIIYKNINLNQKRLLTHNLDIKRNSYNRFSNIFLQDYQSGKYNNISKNVSNKLILQNCNLKDFMCGFRKSEKNFLNQMIKVFEGKIPVKKFIFDCTVYQPVEYYLKNLINFKADLNEYFINVEKILLDVPLCILFKKEYWKYFEFNPSIKFIKLNVYELDKSGFFSNQELKAFKEILMGKNRFNINKVKKLKFSMNNLSNAYDLLLSFIELYLKTLTRQHLFHNIYFNIRYNEYNNVKEWIEKLQKEFNLIYCPSGDIYLLKHPKIDLNLKISVCISISFCSVSLFF